MSEPESTSAVPQDVAEELLDRVATSASSGFRWQWGLGILTAGVVAEVAVWTALSPDATYQVFWSMPVVSGTLFLLALWWLFASGLEVGQKLSGVGVVAAACGIFIALFRFEGFAGDFWPRFKLRSAPTAEEKLQEFLAEEATTPTMDAELKLNPDVDWPGFRGANRDGIAHVRPNTFNWTTKPQELWRHPVGRGWSSFSVVDGLAFTQEQREDVECVVAYDIETGQQLWAREDNERFDEAMGGPGPRATPTFHEGRLYSLGATGLLNCLDARTGELFWQKNILDEASADNIAWAMSGSPLIVDDLLIVNPGGKNDSSVVAYDRLSGEKIWSVGSDPASYAAPSLRTLLGQQQVVVFDGEGVKGYSPDSGTEFWRVAWTNGPKVNAAEPIPVSERHLFIGSGYGVGSGLIELAHDGDQWTTKTVWSSRKFKLKFNAAVQQGSFAYGLDEGILACIDMETGEQAWKRGRYGYGQILLAGDAVVVLAENGDVAFVEASPDGFNEQLRFETLDGKTWNHPVIWNDLLLVRNGEEAACFRLAEL